MAFTKQLPSDVLVVVADQIGARIEAAEGNIHFLSLDGAALPTQGLSVGESFEVWRLIPDAIEAIALGTLKIERLARRSGLWHHQIRRTQQTVGFARSKPLGPDPSSWSLRDIFMSEVAMKIDNAVSWIDENNVPDEVEVRFLSFPTQQVEAFWFVSEDLRVTPDWGNKILIINAPDRIPQFGFLKIMDSTDFLTALVTPDRGMGIRST